MIVNKNNKSFVSRSDKPNENWLDDNNYFVVPDDSELYYKIIQAGENFNFVLDEKGNLIDIKPIYTIEEIKENKTKELESFITNIRSQGIEYKDQLWSIDEDCEKNLTSQITLLSFAPTDKVNWFSKTQVNELTIDEFKELALVLSNAIANAKMKYYTYKNAIERAETEEDLEEIIFE